MSRAGLRLVRNLRRDFIAWQVFRQLFVPLLARLATAVLGDDLLQVVHRLGQPQGCVGRFLRVAKVQSKLVRILDVAFAAIAKSLLHQLVKGQLVLVAFLRELLDGLIFGLKGDVLLPKLLALQLQATQAIEVSEVMPDSSCCLA